MYICKDCPAIFEELLDAELHYAEWGHNIQGVDTHKVDREAAQEEAEHRQLMKGSVQEGMEVFWEKSNR